MEDLPLGRISALVPAFAVTDLPLGRILMMMMIMCIYHFESIIAIDIEVFSSAVWSLAQITFYYSCSAKLILEFYLLTCKTHPIIAEK